MKKTYYSWSHIEGACLDIVRQMYINNWKPDYIVGITRGGLIPATLISHYIKIPMNTLNVSLRDYTSKESNCWMAEDAFGYKQQQKKILLVDDINDTGETIKWIKDDWKSCCIPNHELWDTVWGDNVRIATLTSNLSSKETVDYYKWECNKAEDDVWIVYPWEDFWNEQKIS